MKTTAKNMDKTKNKTKQGDTSQINVNLAQYWTEQLNFKIFGQTDHKSEHCHFKGELC